VKILDRYLVREIVPPLLLALVGLTFVLMLPPIMQNLAKLIAKGVAWTVVLRVLLTLMPQALSVTIPMALLYGVLFGLGRWSADREFVAMQACGVSVFRILRPIILLALVAAGATAYETIIALPDANQTFRQVTFNIVASGAESDIKPRVFYQSFPNRVLYARDIQNAGGWRDVFLADSTRPDETTVYVAAAGQLIIDRSKQTVTLLLERGSSYTTYLKKPAECDVHAFERLVLDMDANTVFNRTQLIKGDNEKTIAELRETAAENRLNGRPFNSQLYTIQQKFSLPAACVVLALIGLGLGASNRKDGKLASFALGTGVVFVYYVLLYTSRAAAFANRISPVVAPWLVNVVLGGAAVALVLWRAGSADQPIRLTLPAFWRRRDSDAAGASPSGGSAVAAAAPARRPVVVVRIPDVNWLRPRLLDVYVARQYLSVFAVSFLALVGIFYIATLIDLADKVLGGVASTSVLVRYFYFATPQYVYYILPMGALVATLVTVGLLTKTSELIVMRACGISLYRSALPLIVFAVMLSAVLFELQEQVLSESNREAQRLNAIMRGYPMQTVGVMNRQWIIGKSGDIYWYQAFDPRRNQFRQLSVFHLADSGWQLDQLTYAGDVVLERVAGGEDSLTWQARHGWTREFSTGPHHGASRLLVNYQPFTEKPISLEAPAYFKTEDPDADRMTYSELKAYIGELKASGYHVVPYQVSLQQKLAFPFVAIIMTLIAVPFAVTTGRSGAIYGIGVGLVLAIVYRTALSLFGALGSGGWVDPTLAAWAPNILFGAAAAYMLLTVRT
jgi:LPS export ABC transporter permease LptF/LPS export ABC transporter permease LptG